MKVVVQDFTSRLCGVYMSSVCMCGHIWSSPTLLFGGSRGAQQKVAFIAADMEQLNLCDAISAAGVAV